MALLVLVVLSLAGFLAIESRVASAGLATRQARLNALASAREAIGVLQQEMGPDQRISASAGLLDANPETADLNDGSAAGPLHHPNWVGSWNSYRPGLKRDSEYDTVGKGNAPLALRRLASAPSYEKAGVIGGDRTFRRWLVSTGYDTDWETTNANLALAAGLRTDNSAAEALRAMRGAWLWNPASTGTGAQSAQLLGAGTLGLPASTTANSARADAPLVPFPAPAGGAPAGRFAWWATDNSQRATVNLAPRPEPANTWERVQAVFAPERKRPEVPHGAAGASPLALQGSATRTTAKDFAFFGFDPALAASASTYGDLGGAMSDTAASDPAWRTYWLDYTTSSRGVLANPLNGDLKSDINLILENPSRVHPPSRHIDIAAANSNINPSVTDNWYNYALLDTIDEARNYLFYFHRQSADENSFLGRIRPYRGTSWTDLWRWYQSYKPDEGRSLSSLTPLRSVPAPVSTHTGYTPGHQYLDKYEMLNFPRFAKIQYVYSYTAQPFGTMPDGKTTRYRLGLSFVPVVTIWNPFNFRLTFPDDVSAFMKCAGVPVGFHIGFRRWDAATETHGAVDWVTPGSPAMPPMGQRWVHTSFFATTTYISNYRAKDPLTSRSKLWMEPGEVIVFSPNLASDYVKMNSGEDGFASYPGYNPEYGIVNYGDTIGTGQVLPSVTPVGQWAWTGGPDDLVVIQPYYSDHTANRTWNSSETAMDFWTDKGWPVQEYRGHFITSFKSAVEGPSGQNTFKLNYNPAKFRSVRLSAAEGKKYPFMAMSLYLKSEQGTAAAGRQYPNLAFLHSSLLSRNQTLDGDQKDLLWLRNVGIEFYIDQLFGTWDTDAVQLDELNRGFVGSGLTAENGSRFWAGSEQPYWPTISLGLLQNAQMGNQGLGGWRTQGTWISGGAIDFAFGNSAGFPGIPVDAVTNQGNESAAAWASLPAMTGTRFLIDHAYLANWSGWDYYFISSLTRQDTAGFDAHGVTRRDFAQVLDEFMRGATPLPNRRLTWVRGTGEADNSKAWSRLMTSAVPYAAEGIPAGTTRQGDRAQTDAHARLARNLLLEGAFNVNSISKEAWRALLFAARGQELAYDGTSSGSPGSVKVEKLKPTKPEEPCRTPFPRFAMPLGPCADKAGTEESYWSGFRALTDAQVDALAEEIVKEVKQRGPFLSLGEFINRRVAPRASGNRDWFAKQSGRATGSLADSRPETRGALQAAIDRTDINARFGAAGRTYTTAELTASDPTLPGMANNYLGNAALANFPADGSGKVARAYGANGFLTQADVLNVIGSFLAVRGDTFTLRCLGESPRGDARAVCEIVVQRLPEYVRHRDTAATNPNEGDSPETNWGQLKDSVNKSLGRRFRIVSFRWLSPSEI